MTIFPRPSEWARSTSGRARQQPSAADLQHYFAFLSYSHRDEKIARWLHESLEKFRVPHHLVGRLTEHGAIPRRLTPIFRDLHELAASDDLGAEIREAIAGSRFLIVLCSPAAAQSPWTNAEIEAFKRVRPEGCILAAVVEGEPFASDMPGRENEECFPPALRFKYDRRGRPTAKRAEPLAADLRGGEEARRLAMLKLVAGMLGVGLDELVQRDQVRRQRRHAMLTAASLAGMVTASALALTAIQARDAARDQRREAEGLIGFMLGDLKEKLQPVGRLDALDSVGSRVLAYYQRQDMSELTDPALLQRSRALGLMGDVARLRGDSDGALRLYRESYGGTAEAVRRKPDDPQRLFEHAQNVFWIGELARQRGRLDSALAATREYQRLARRMVAAEPDNMKWRMEVQNAEANLGIILQEQRRFGEAARQFARALAMIEALATADPSNREYQKSRAESLAWLADAHLADGKLREAVTLRQRHVALLNSLLESSGGDVEYRQRLVPAYGALGNAYAALGEGRLALQNLNAAVEQADRLTAVEPSNSFWREFAARARLDLAAQMLATRMLEQARAQATSGCALAERLLAEDVSNVHRQRASRDCLAVQAQLALGSGAKARAIALSARMLDMAQAARDGDAIANRYAVARAARLLGDARRSSGDRAGAQRAWHAALAQLPAGVVERPAEIDEHLQLLQRLGRTGEADRLKVRLNAMGYRQGA